MSEARALVTRFYAVDYDSAEVPADQIDAFVDAATREADTGNLGGILLLIADPLAPMGELAWTPDWMATGQAVRSAAYEVTELDVVVNGQEQ